MVLERGEEEGYTVSMEERKGEIRITGEGNLKWIGHHNGD